MHMRPLAYATIMRHYFTDIIIAHRLALVPHEEWYESTEHWTMMWLLHLVQRKRTVGGGRKSLKMWESYTGQRLDEWMNVFTKNTQYQASKTQLANTRWQDIFTNRCLLTKKYIYFRLRTQTGIDIKQAIGCVSRPTFSIHLHKHFLKQEVLVTRNMS